MARGPKPTYGFYVVRPERAAVSVQLNRGDGACARPTNGLSAIEITGVIDRPVIRCSRASIWIYEEHERVRGPGSARGIRGELWSVTLWLPRALFQDLLAIVLADKLARIQLVVHGLRRGKAPIVSVSFHTSDDPEGDAR
jgi:hypothetical protein